MRSMLAAACLLIAAIAVAAPTPPPTMPSPDGWCVANPGRGRSTVVCDYGYIDSPVDRPLRIRTVTVLGRRGQARCYSWELYDPTIDRIQEGRIVATETACFPK